MTVWQHAYTYAANGSDDAAAYADWFVAHYADDDAQPQQHLPRMVAPAHGQQPVNSTQRAARDE